MKTWIFILTVFVVDDGQWREWKSFTNLRECEEVVSLITYRREDKIQAYCKAKEIDEQQTETKQ
jgi:hypothetical protein